ncbi:MAG: hypothetical protein ACRD0M_08470 [Acidimicrobiales bacterium]
MAVADAWGAKVGPTHHYDPDGVALTSLPDNSAGDMGYARLGSHSRPLEHVPGRGGAHRSRAAPPDSASSAMAGCSTSASSL